MSKNKEIIKVSSQELLENNAYQRMLRFNQKHPDSKEVYRAMQKWQIDNKPKDGVFYPSGLLYRAAPRILVSHFNGSMPMGRYDKMDEAQRDISSYYWGLHLFGAWRNTLGVYRFDKKIFTEVYRSQIPDDTPSTIFSRLPEWCVYVEFPKETLAMPDDDGDINPCEGFWALYDQRPYNGKVQTVLNLVLNYPGKLLNSSEFLQPFQLVIDEDLTVKESLIGLSSETSHKQDDILASRVCAANDTELTMFLLSLLLWLCAEEPDIVNMAGEPLSKGDLRIPKYGVNKKTGNFIPPSTPTIYELGKRLGAEVQSMKDRLAESGTQEYRKGGRKRPHIRAPHWHGVWVGTGQNKRYKLNWIKPIFVNAN